MKNWFVALAVLVTSGAVQAGENAGALLVLDASGSMWGQVDGRAKIEVKVPDRLTTWHVLALAHSREGAQAGTTADFLGTLPTYVDPVVPPFLIAGDEVRLPVQIVNTTNAAIATKLELSAVGGALSTNGGPVKVPAEGNEVQYVTLKVPPETQNGRRIRLRGKGMPHLKDPSAHGDLFAIIDVRLPTGLSDEERALVERLRELRPAG